MDDQQGSILFTCGVCRCEWTFTAKDVIPQKADKYNKTRNLSDLFDYAIDDLDQLIGVAFSNGTHLICYECQGKLNEAWRGTGANVKPKLGGGGMTVDDAVDEWRERAEKAAAERDEAIKQAQVLADIVTGCERAFEGGYNGPNGKEMLEIIRLRQGAVHFFAKYGVVK